MLPINPSGHQLAHRFLRTSGTVKHSVNIIGAVITYNTRPFQFSGNANEIPDSSSFSSCSTNVSALFFLASKNLLLLYHVINSSLLIWPSLLASHILRAFSTSPALGGLVGSPALAAIKFCN